METKPHICPVWIGYLMNTPLRKLQQNPFRILGPYVRPGMQVLEIGPAMGFFSLPMAAMIAPDGMLHAVDIQARMLEKLKANVRRKKLEKYVNTILAGSDTLNISHLEGEIDFCLLANVVHEVPNQERLFREVARAMKSKGKVLFMEPGWHVNQEKWENSLNLAKEAGFEVDLNVNVSGSKSCELNIHS